MDLGLCGFGWQMAVIGCENCLIWTSGPAFPGFKLCHHAIQTVKALEMWRKRCYPAAKEGRNGFSFATKTI